MKENRIKAILEGFRVLSVWWGHTGVSVEVTETLPCLVVNSRTEDLFVSIRSGDWEGVRGRLALAGDDGIWAKPWQDNSARNCSLGTLDNTSQEASQEATSCMPVTLTILCI